MGKTLIVLGIIVSMLLLIYYWWTTTLSVYVISQIDNKPYLVRNLSDKQQTSNILAQIRRNIKNLVKYMKVHPSEKYQIYTNNLVQKIDHVLMTENINDFMYTSYSVNKGEQLVFCLRSRKTKDEIHDLNLMMYVVLHEISHIACPEYGHGDLFKGIFKYITESGVKLGIYKPIDFKRHNEEYCGIQITDSII